MLIGFATGLAVLCARRIDLRIRFCCCAVGALCCGELSFQGCDLRFHPDHVGVLLAEVGAEVRQLLLQPGQPELGQAGGDDLGVTVWDKRIDTGGHRVPVRILLPCERKLSCELLPFHPLQGPRLVLLIETELGIQPSQRGQVHRHLFGQLA